MFLRLRFTTVNIRGGGHMRMTEAMADAHAVNPVKGQHTYLCMTERMRVDVRQAMALAEFRQSVTDVSPDRVLHNSGILQEMP